MKALVLEADKQLRYVEDRPVPPAPDERPAVLVRIAACGRTGTGTAGSILVLRIFYQFPVFLGPLGLNLAHAVGLAHELALADVRRERDGVRISHGVALALVVAAVHGVRHGQQLRHGGDGDVRRGLGHLEHPLRQLRQPDGHVPQRALRRGRGVQ